MQSLLNTKNICKILKDRQIISPATEEEILSKEQDQRKRLEKLREIKKDYKVRGISSDQEISDIEVISTLKLSSRPSPQDNQKSSLTEEIIMTTIAASLGYPFKKIDPLDLDLDTVTQTLPKPFALKNLLLPINIENSELTIAIHDPTYINTLCEDIKKFTELKISVVISTKSDILKIITEFFGFKSSVVAAEKLHPPRLVNLENLDQFIQLKDSEIQSTDEHIKNAVNFLFHYALDQRASDIHLEPKRERALIRLRIDGILHDVHVIPKNIHAPITSRIKMLGRMDIAEKRKPQDGRIRLSYGSDIAEIRASTIPTAFGEKIVLRILDPSVIFRNLEELGFTPADLINYHSIIKQPHGVVLVTGPTGSGKTTTLYSSLRYLSTPENNIITIEDPVEMICEEFNQIAVQPQVGITFAKSMRNILRQDPDIIMIGEIRDHETAENAIQAAMTGHLVFSTVHTNDSCSTVTRLVDLGVENFLIGSSVIGIVAQRLIRRICRNCEETFILSGEELQQLGIPLRSKIEEIKLKRGKGCPNCRNTGYHGRIGVFEVLKITPKIREMIFSRANSVEIRKEAGKQGMVTLRESALQKMLKGLTTYNEVLQVTLEE